MTKAERAELHSRVDRAIVKLFTVCDRFNMDMQHGDLVRVRLMMLAIIDSEYEEDKR